MNALSLQSRYKSLKLIMVAVLAVWLSGCASPLHYSWAYTPLYDAKEPIFIPPSNDIGYKEVDDMEAAERDMFRQGYVMIGYCYMDSPQLEMIAESASKKWGKKVGASYVVHKYGKSRYLATYWAKPVNYILGAYYQDDRHALYYRKRQTNAVIVLDLVDGSPAFEAGFAPGDIILSVDGVKVTEAAGLNGMLLDKAGQEVVITLLPNEIDLPVDFPVKLNAKL